MGERPPEWDIEIDEYKAAQDSAQHHDNLTWNTTALLWAGNFVLLGFVVNGLLTKPAGNFVPLACILGLVLTIAVWRIAYLFNKVKNVKYKRCQEIEKKYGMKQHLMMNDKKTYPKRAMMRLYAVVSIAFLLAWFLILLCGICDKCPAL